MEYEYCAYQSEICSFIFICLLKAKELMNPHLREFDRGIRQKKY